MILGRLGVDAQKIGNNISVADDNSRRHHVDALATQFADKLLGLADFRAGA